MHPDHRELQLTLMVPGPPLDEESAGLVRRLMEKGALRAAGLAVDDCRKTYADLVAKGGPSCRNRPSVPTAWKR